MTKIGQDVVKPLMLRALGGSFTWKRLFLLGGKLYGICCILLFHLVIAIDAKSYWSRNIESSKRNGFYHHYGRFHINERLNGHRGKHFKVVTSLFPFLLSKGDKWTSQSVRVSFGEPYREEQSDGRTVKMFYRLTDKNEKHEIVFIFPSGGKCSSVLFPLLKPPLPSVTVGNPLQRLHRLAADAALD